jgi:hypothetical protein
MLALHTRLPLADEWRRVVQALQKEVRALGAHDVPASRASAGSCRGLLPACFVTPIRSNAIR